MHFATFEMDRRIDNDQNFMNFGGSLPSPLQHQANYSNVGGARHQFNVPEMRYLYPVPSRFGSTPLQALNRVSSYNIRGRRAPPASMLPGYVPNTSSQELYTVGGDGQARTSAPSPTRRTSHMHGVEPTGNSTAPQAELCVCKDDPGNNGPQSPDLNELIDAYTRAQSYPRVPVDRLLNTPTKSQIPSLSDQDARARSMSILDPNENMAQIEPPSINMSVCSSTNTSSVTIRPALNVPEERFYLLNTLYRICQSATTEYIHTSPRVHRRTRSSHGYSRHHPYPSRPTQTSRLATRIEDKKSPTLLDNISKISTRLWRKARRDLVAPHREEADAVCDMRDLYKWAETIATSMVSDGVDEADDSESDGSGTESPGSGVPGMKVAKAAKRLCRWLGDEEAWERCDTVMGELRDLVEHDGGEREFGNIE